MPTHADKNHLGLRPAPMLVIHDKRVTKTNIESRRSQAGGDKSPPGTGGAGKPGTKEKALRSHLPSAHSQEPVPFGSMR